MIAAVILVVVALIIAVYEVVLAFERAEDRDGWSTWGDGDG